VSSVGQRGPPRTTAAAEGPPGASLAHPARASLGLAFDLSGADAPAAIGVESLQPGDLLLLYTDGVTEARSAAGEFFGIDRLIDLVTRNLAAGLPAPETLRRVIRAVLEHQGDELDDNASLMLVKWRGNAPEKMLLDSPAPTGIA